MGLILVKANVQPYSLTIMAAVANVAQLLPWDVVVTSANDSRHMHTSKHYSGEAIDVRSKNFPDKASKEAFLSAVLARLGHGYEGLLEDEGGPNEHLHIERDVAVRADHS